MLAGFQLRMCIYIYRLIIKLKTERSGKGSSEEESSRCQVFRPFKLPYTLEEPGHTWGSARCSLATLFPSRDLNPGPPGSYLWFFAQRSTNSATDQPVTAVVKVPYMLTVQFFLFRLVHIQHDAFSAASATCFRYLDRAWPDRPSLWNRLYTVPPAKPLAPTSTANSWVLYPF